jgi:hypothetical protein
MNSATELPYELHTQGYGAFVTFALGEQIALPLLTLARATLRGTDATDELVLEFHGVEVAIAGHGLSLLLEHLLAGRVKRISVAHDGTCGITAIRIIESAS